MKKLLSVLLIVVTMLGLFSSTALATKYVVRTNEGRGMNVRSAKHNGSILGVIPDGTVVEALEVDKYWITIMYNGRKAYLYIDYVKPVADPIPPRRTTTPTKKQSVTIRITTYERKGGQMVPITIYKTIVVEVPVKKQYNNR